MHELRCVSPTNCVCLNHVFKSLSRLIIKLKSLMKYFRKVVLKYFEIFVKFFFIFQSEIFHRASIVELHVRRPMHSAIKGRPSDTNCFKSVMSLKPEVHV